MDRLIDRFYAGKNNNGNFYGSPYEVEDLSEEEEGAPTRYEKHERDHD